MDVSTGVDTIVANRKYLDPIDLQSINNFASEQQKFQLEINLLKMTIQRNQIMIENFDLRRKLIENEIGSINMSIDRANGNLQGIKENFKKKIDELKIKYELPDEWGFEPDSGEIIIKE